MRGEVGELTDVVRSDKPRTPTLMSVYDLHFTAGLLAKPKPTSLVVATTLDHFVIVTYLVDPATLRGHVHPRFELDCIEIEGAGKRALVSVVTFLDRDFRLLKCPWPKSRFGQTNYRAYVTDTVTGEHVAWFFGTCLDSLSVAVPRHVWGLPWHRGRMQFDCQYDDKATRYESFVIETQSSFAPAHLEIEDLGVAPRELAGFPNLEAGLVLLTHPTRGVFFRRDGSVGTYSIWHDRLDPTVGRARRASYPLLADLGLVAEGSVDNVHSVLIQPSVEFLIYLPPSAAF